MAFIEQKAKRARIVFLMEVALFFGIQLRKKRLGQCVELLASKLLKWLEIGPRWL
jgi:hypothetical protein